MGEVVTFLCNRKQVFCEEKTLTSALFEEHFRGEVHEGGRGYPFNPQLLGIALYWGKSAKKFFIRRMEGRRDGRMDALMV